MTWHQLVFACLFAGVTIPSWFRDRPPGRLWRLAMIFTGFLLILAFTER